MGIKLMSNLTRLRELTHQLNNEETLYRFIFNNMECAVVLINDKGQVINFNDQASENLGYTTSEFQDIGIEKFDVNESGEDVLEHLKQIKDLGRVKFKAKHVSKNGRFMNVEVVSRYFRLHDVDYWLSVWNYVWAKKTDGSNIENWS